MSSVLVAYASKHGSTAEIAEAVAETLRAAGHEVRCAPADHVESLDGYDAVVLGSAVYARRWRREARRFLHRHETELPERAFWVFSSGPVGDPAKDDPGWTEPRATIAEAERLGARGHPVFGGAIPLESARFLRRSMASNTPAEYRDRRDWDEIGAWAGAIASALERPAAAP